jgi:hypothetical protein
MITKKPQNCPHCDRHIPFTEFEDKWMKSDGLIKIKCKCKRIVWITESWGGFVVFEMKSKKD